MASKQLESLLNKTPRATAAQPPKLEVVGETAQPIETLPAAPASASISPEGAARAPKAAKPARPAKAAARAGEGEVPIAAVVPVSLRKAILTRAVQDDLTMRGIILQGLQAIGFDISDEMIRDRRTR